MIQHEKENYVLNVNREEYVRHITDRFSIPLVELHTDKMLVEPEEMQVSAQMYPSGYYVHRDGAYPQLVVTYVIPVNDTEMMERQANTYSLSPPRIWTEKGLVKFYLIQFDRTPEQLKTEADKTIEALRSGVERLNIDIRAYNSQLYTKIEKLFDERKAELLKRRDFLAALNVPIKTTDLAKTFSAPITRTPTIAPKPTAPDAPFKPEPTVDQKTYHQILEVIHKAGIGMERHPSAYAQKGEEDLRDLFILFLTQMFEQGSTTGETFNKSGKTDILMRHENSNIFVAECKIWKGPKGCIEALDQLISYLTWRDSKACLMFFVRAAGINEVITSAKETIPKHSNFLGGSADTAESWLNYRLHVAGDKSREIKVAVLFFHFPPL